MSILLYFLLGAAFIYYVHPILDKFAGLILTVLELKQSKLTVGIYENNLKMTELERKMEIEEEAKNPIGFVSGPCEIEEKQYEEDNDI